MRNNRKLRIPLLINLHIKQLRIPLHAALRIPQQIRLENPLNPSLMNRNLVLKPRRHTDIRHNRRPLNNITLGLPRRIPKRDLLHVAPIIQYLVRKTQRFQDLERSWLQPVGLARFQCSGLRVDAEEGGVVEAVAREEEVEHESGGAGAHDDDFIFRLCRRVGVCVVFWEGGGKAG
jgi:hypothetical protein